MEKIIIGTGSYYNVKSGNTVSITGDGGKAWGYNGPAYKKLAPSWKIYSYYSTNPDNLSKKELEEWYIKEFYELRLKNIRAKEYLQILSEKFGKNIIILCHEPTEEFCHRRVFASYVELETGICIPEISISEKGEIKYLPYIDYKEQLVKIMK